MEAFTNNIIYKKKLCNSNLYEIINNYNIETKSDLIISLGKGNHV